MVKNYFYAGSNKSNREAGFTLLEIMVVTAIIAIITSIALPNIMHARETANAEVCAANREALRREEVMFQERNSRPSESIEELASSSDRIYNYIRCPKAGVLFWVEPSEGSTALVNSLVGCSRHGFDLTVEEAEDMFPDIVLSDDFDGTLSEWSSVKGKWSIVDGRLYGTTNNNVLLTGESDAEDNIIKTNVSFNDKRNGTAGIVFRTTLKRGKLYSGYGVELDKKSKEFIFTKTTKGRSSDKLKVDAPAGFDWSKPHSLQVNAVGDKFTLYVDGKDVLSYIDDSYTSGSVGLSSSKKNSSFEDFEVTEAK